MTSRPATSRILRMLRGVGALLVLVAVVVGVPLLLAWLRLTPHGIPTAHQVTTALRRRDDGQLAAVVIAAGAWLCWALFTISLLPEIAAAVRNRPAFDLPGLGVFQRPAGALVAAIAIALTAAPLTAGAGAAAKAAPPPPLPTPSPVQLSAPRPVPTLPPAAEHRNGNRPLAADAQQPGAPASAAVPTDQTPTRAAPTYVVQRRDTLWGIAERYLHNPLRYSEIAHLNPAAVGPDNEITPRAVLTLPPDATGLPADHAAGRGDAGTEVTVRPGDTLWDIEEQLTGSGANWQQGWQANAGRAEPGGATYTDADLIQPGWTLTIPTPRPATATTPTATPAHPTTGPGDQHAQPPPAAAPSPPSIPATPAPGSPTPSAPAQSPEPTGNSAPSPARTHADSSSASDLPMLAFAGGGLLLAGLALTALTGYRRRQFRHRRPGRIIAGTPAELIATERAVRAAGSAGVADVTWLDQVLRGLVQTIAGDPDGRLPDVIAVRLTADELTLVLAEPSLTAPLPWRVDDTGGRWTIQRSDPIPYEADRRGYYFAPYPTLISVGHTAGGEHWLLDLERIGALSLVGDRDRCLNLARFLAAELAHNTWSEMLQVTLVGFGRELVAANPDRLTYTDDLPATLSAVARERESVLDAIRVTDVDLLTGRLRDIAGDTWAPHVVWSPHR